MKASLIVCSIILCCFITRVQAQGFEDKAKHFGSGFVIGGLGGYGAHKIFNEQRHWRWIGATGGSLAAAIAKESWDKSRGIEPETNDIVYTVLGGVVSAITLELLFNKKRKRKNRKNCGCLVTSLDDLNYNDAPFFITKGNSQNITAAIQAQSIRDDGN